MCGVVAGGEVGVFLVFFQAEDGIRYYKVTGVQTCALPIWIVYLPEFLLKQKDLKDNYNGKIGRASCRERV